MDFAFTEEQELLRDSIQKFVRENYELVTRRKLAKPRPGYSEENWQTYAELGWLGVPFPEEYGGIGGNLIDTMVVMEEFGRGLVLEPYFPTVVMMGNALLLGGTESQKQKIIPEIIEGKAKGTVAFVEEQARYDLADVATTASKSGDGYLINGTKSVVMNAATADYIVVTTRTSGERADSAGITLFLVDANAEGISRLDYPTVDGLRASEVTFENVKVTNADVLGQVGEGLSVIEQVVDRGILALAAEAVGMMEVLYQDTTEYTSQREQFGHPLANFQTVKHRIVDMFVDAELTRSLLYRATLEVQAGHEDAKLDVHALKHMVGKAGRFVGQSAVQLHGGMGQTEELRVGHYFVRLAAIDAHFGDKDHHLAKYADMMPIPEGEPDANMLPF